MHEAVLALTRSEATAEAVADVPNFADPDEVPQLGLEEHVQADGT